MPITPPDLRLSLTELPRATMETARLLMSLPSLVKKSPKGKGNPVLLLPGYGGGDGSMLAMRHFLNKLGYSAYGLELGRNRESSEERIMCVDDALAFRDKMAGLVGGRLADLHKEHGEPVTLIGWSMGGCYALDVSQQHPDKVGRVITLGTPYGDPRGTATFSILRKLNKSDVPIESQNFPGWLERREVKTSHIPIHVIYSPNDGIVSIDIACLDEAGHIEHIEVDSSHVGFAWNPAVYSVIARVMSHT